MPTGNSTSTQATVGPLNRKWAPRHFDFVTNCADLQIESQRLEIVPWGYTRTQEQYDEALAKLGTSPLGHGRLWITDFSISHADDTGENHSGKIEWMKFSVEIKLPAATGATGRGM